MRVLTTKQLADFYGVDQINIKKNFFRNKEKYIEGKHYILLQGDELRQFKKIILEITHEDCYDVTSQEDNLSLCKTISVAFSNVPDELTVCSTIQISSNAKSLYLWTERGALLHAKSVNTDKAWDVYEQLLDVYFRAKEVFAPEDDSPVSQTPLPKVPNWHSINYRRIDNLCSVLGIDRKHMYHLVLMRCSETYDLNEAKIIYKRERGFAPQYAIDIVGYFPELKEIADDYLDELELLYRREVRE